MFFGGGTPTLLPPADLAAVIAAIDAEFGLAPGAEVTTESNPDSVTEADLEALREGGITRISFGMQSAVAHVLRTLDRTHDPRRVPSVVRWARAAGFDQVSLDLIYGTPGESLADWEASVDAALACEPDHVSAYALIVEEGTALARQVRRGEVPMPDDDDLADKYLAADERLEAAGLGWYEVSELVARPRRAAAATTCSTGPAPTGGASAPVRTRTWVACGGGTSSTRWRTPTGSPPTAAPPTRARCSTTRPAGSSGCCSRCGCATGCRSTRSTTPAGPPCRSSSSAGCCGPPAGDRLVLSRTGRLLADAVVRDLLA